MSPLYLLSNSTKPFPILTIFGTRTPETNLQRNRPEEDSCRRRLALDYCEHVSTLIRKLCYNFKVAGTVKKSLNPCEICGPLSILQQAPCISSQAVILTKFRFTSCVPMDLTISPRRNKSLFEASERQIAEMAGLGAALPCVPAHFNPGWLI